MSASTVYCHVLQGNITAVTDIDGNVKNIVCPPFWCLTHGCKIKRSQSSVLGIITKRLKDVKLVTRENICEFAGSEDSSAAKLGKSLSGNSDS